MIRENVTAVKLAQNAMHAWQEEFDRAKARGASGAEQREICAHMNAAQWAYWEELAKTGDKAAQAYVEARKEARV